MLKFTNTLSGQLEEFRPINEGEVRMYYCGPTVWDYGHIGNFRSNIFTDILSRYLRFKGFQVTHVMNITDVEDRIIALSQKNGVTIDEYTAKYIEALWEDFDALGCARPDIVPRATRHIPEMVAGASERVDTDKYEKEDARDFALWKGADSPDEPAWDTTLGRGRPGWHIECSAMSMKYLGETFDIHAGGIDLVFPHHENEIAQSEGATGKPFAKYWIHFEHLKVEGESMSKSKGNFYTFRDITAKGFAPVAVRYFLMSVPYRKQLNFTFEALRGAEKTVLGLRDFRSRLKDARAEAGANPNLQEAAARALKDFEAGFDDDLNTSVALAALHNLAREVNTAIDEHALREDNKGELLALLDRFNSVLNIFEDEQPVMLDKDVQSLIDERQEARRRRDFARADEIRDELTTRGITLEDTKDGVRWKRR
jgi:cysteinyl-tRNA synthetase